MIQKPKGTADLFGDEARIWQYVEETARIIFNDYRFEEMRTPLFESYELFSRGVGDTSDIVSKEMYDFYDKGERHMTLRPEGTAAIVRSYVENKLFGPEHKKPYKTYYMAPMFRYERPQSGRMRQFHQIGVEVFGSTNPAVDVETIALAWDLLKELGLSNIKLVINSLGKNEDRIKYRQALIDYLEPHFDELSADSQTRLHKNPLRVLDSKDKKDIELVKDAPSILDFLSEESQKHFEMVQAYLTALDIPFEIDTNMVRGLDYYQDTIFEIMTDSKSFGAKTTICGGGRYDGLVEDLDGPETPGFGFGMGIERLVLLMKDEEVEIPNVYDLDVYMMGIGEDVQTEVLTLTYKLRQQGYSVDRDFFNRKPKAQFKQAQKQNATMVITIGDEEVENQEASVKIMAKRKEIKVPFSELATNFDVVYRQATMDTTAIDEYFNAK
ncbi:histidyl-tRNA synthetase [Granulicatella balaenopterae]|uniref:Histidine--tRNA ligase n=1 Tax=Granulicatella balaenopterae TaxID=137733 RepID=A0A1H9MRE3_9LACT|nr:histidyl-tRNA synthetase [Granulicatella balaenopterae]